MDNKINDLYEEAFKRMRLEHDMSLKDIQVLCEHKKIFMGLLDGSDRENYDSDIRMVDGNYTFGNHDLRYCASCPSCGANLEDGRKFPTPYERCEKCGQKLIWK